MLDIKHSLLLVLGILVLAKSLWGLAAPPSVKKFAAWWLRVFVHVNTLTAFTYFCIALAIWAIILLDSQMSDYLLAVMGLLMAIGAVLCLSPETMKRVTRRSIMERGPMWIRAFSLMGLVLAVFMIWVAMTNR